MDSIGWKRISGFVSDLERSKAKGETLAIRLIGVLILKDDIPPELAAEVIELVQGRGVLNASDAVKAALAGRIH